MQTSNAILDLCLSAIEDAGPDAKLYWLGRPDRAVLPAATAGAHITLILPIGVERQYSIVHPDAAPTAYVVAVKKEAAGRGGSAHIHENLRVGDLIRARPPRNNFPLVEAASFTLLIAGGIGVTPMVAMAERLMVLGRPFELHAAFRGHAHLILGRELAALPNVSLHYDDEADGVFPMAERIAATPRDAHLYCCGPRPMIESFLAAAKADGRDEAFVHVEYFTADVQPVSAGSFVVELAKSGLTLTVPPGKSILSVVEAAGVATLSSCEEGICGACETKVLDGIPDHRDAVLSPTERRENKTMMICCSGALSDRLVLDL